MKSISVFILLISTSFCIQGQIIHGVVSDDQTKKSIDYALVYINGTFTGVQTNKSGQFRLDISKNPSMPVTISALGYQSVIINNPKTDTALYVYLTPKVFTLDEVVVSARESIKTRRSHMKQFKDQFLGRTQNANRCKILNEDDIYFSYNSDTKVLSAYSSSPVMVINNALGYKISYFLDKFEFNDKSHSLILTGNIKFDENLSSDKSDNNSFERRRRFAYQGSRMHFIRSLWNDELSTAGFNILDSLNHEIARDSLVMPKFDTVSHQDFMYLKNCKYFKVYYNEFSQGSMAIFMKETVYFEENGYYDLLGLSWDGEMAKRRIADQIPYDYSYTSGR